MTDTPEPPLPEPAPPPPQAPAPDAVPQAAPARQIPYLPILIGIAVIALIGAGIGYVSMQGRTPDQSVYTVEPFAPTTEIITARDRVEGFDAPDAASPVIVVFGPSVTLNVSGRVTRGIGNDWYAVAWGERTVFVRQQDSTPGSGAPPSPIVREDEPEELEDEEDKKPEDPFAEEEDVAEAQGPAYGLEMSDVRWIREPNARDFARFYPDRALDDSRSGRVVLDCVVAGSGRLDCSVAQESPGGYGFGEAALGISRQVRVDTDLPSGGSAAGRRLRLPLSFQAG